RYGYRVVLDVFKKVNSEKLSGFVVWLAVRPTDNLTAAQAEAKTSTDPRIREFWNEDLSVDAAFMQTLKLSRTAFDTYLVYGPQTKWSTETPSPPQFWMHQRSAKSGADESKHLNAKRLKQAIEKSLAER